MFLTLAVLQIGLAVGDIAGVQRNAALKRIAMQVCMEATVYWTKKFKSFYSFEWN